jgi:putative transcriptional regulator
MARKTRKSLFERLKDSLEEAEKFAAGELTLKTFAVPDPPPTYTPARVARVRKSLRMSQGVFAHVLNVSTKTVQSWEQGLREPTQAAQRLLEVLEKRPEIIATL